MLAEPPKVGYLLPPPPVPFSMSGFPAHWLSDPAWLAMDATARGLHTQLLLVAARRRPTGVLPDDDAAWRKWLGLPSVAKAAKSGPLPDVLPVPAKRKAKSGAAPTGLPDALVSAWEAAAEGQPEALDALGKGADAWVEHLWLTHWKPQVLAAWRLIDAELVAEEPRLAGHEGGWWHPDAARLAGVGDARATADAAPARGAKKGKKPVRTGVPPLPGVGGTGAVPGATEPLGDPAEPLGGSTDALREYERVLAAWRTPVPLEQRASLWDLGVQALIGGGAMKEREARSFLGHLINKYGEKAVAEGVAELTRRAVAPAESSSFLKKMLERAKEGSAAEQKARGQRAGVAL